MLAMLHIRTNPAAWVEDACFLVFYILMVWFFRKNGINWLEWTILISVAAVYLGSRLGFWSLGL